jgi:hypothetical protein
MTGYLTSAARNMGHNDQVRHDDANDLDDPVRAVDSNAIKSAVAASSQADPERSGVAGPRHRRLGRDWRDGPAPRRLGDDGRRRPGRPVPRRRAVLHDSAPARGAGGPAGAGWRTAGRVAMLGS